MALLDERIEGRENLDDGRERFAICSRPGLEV